MYIPLDPDCEDDTFGAGSFGDLRNVSCPQNMVGNITAKCGSAGSWTERKDHCVLRVIQNLKDKAQVI